MPRHRPAPEQLLDGAVRARLVAAGGAARYADLVRRPPDRAELRNLVACGLVVRAGPATYAVPGAARDVVAAARFDASVDCISAARAHGLPALEPPVAVHLAVPRSRSNGRRAIEELRRVRLHRSDDLGSTSSALPGLFPEASLPVWGSAPSASGVPVVRVQEPARALARMLVCCSREDAVTALDYALYRKLVTVDDVERHLPSSAPRSARAALALGDAGGQSLIESLARLALVDAGFTVRTQVSFDGVGDVDLLVEGCVVVECDGFEYHSGRAEYRDDRRRDRILHAGGLVVLRFTYEDIVNDPRCVVRAVRAVLAARAAGGMPLTPPA